MQNIDTILMLMLIVGVIIGWTLGRLTAHKSEKPSTKQRSNGALELAKYVVAKCIRDKRPISNLQLQKILYYIQREFLQKLGRPAFTERIEARAFGPLVPAVYYYFCGAGAMPISVCDEPTAEISEDDRRIIDGIIEEKREIPPWDMASPCGTWNRAVKALVNP